MFWGLGVLQCINLNYFLQDIKNFAEKSNKGHLGKYILNISQIHSIIELKGLQRSSLILRKHDHALESPGLSRPYPRLQNQNLGVGHRTLNFKQGFKDGTYVAILVPEFGNLPTILQMKNHFFRKGKRSATGHSASQKQSLRL